MGRYRRYYKRSNKYELMEFYPIVATISFLIRAYLCYLTIDKIPIISNPVLNELFLEIFSLYTFLMIIGRLTTRIFYVKGVDSPYKGCGIYFIIYICYLFIFFLIMLILTFFKILPV